MVQGLSLFSSLSISLSSAKKQKLWLIHIYDVERTVLKHCNGRSFVILRDRNLVLFSHYSLFSSAVSITFDDRQIASPRGIPEVELDKQGTSLLDQNSGRSEVSRFPSCRVNHPAALSKHALCLLCLPWPGHGAICHDNCDSTANTL